MKKAKIFETLVLLGVLLECVGIYKMAVSILGGVELKGVSFVIYGIVLGIPSAIIWQYAKGKPDSSLDKEKIAIETLAKLSDNRHNSKRN